MKRRMYLFGLVVLMGGLLITSCGKKKDDDKPDITVAFKYDPTNPKAGEEVQFTNATKGGTSYHWDFGDGTTSTDKDPKHVYKEAGTYTVTLKVNNDDNLKASKDITVAPQEPVLYWSPDPIESRVEVAFWAEIYNPDNAPVTWSWKFPADNFVSTDIDADGNATGDTVRGYFISEDPAATIEVTASFGGKDYSKSFSVEVKKQLAPTLYVAEKDGNLYAIKIYTTGEPEVIDMGIESGAHPLTLAFYNDRLYVFNAGSAIRFTDNPEDVPGKIFSVAYDGTDYITHITFHTYPYDDAFFGSVSNGTIYFTDRRNDVTAIPVTTKDAVWGDNGNDANPPEFPALVTNNKLAYYKTFREKIDGGPSYGWGALNGTFVKFRGLYYWGKNSNHKGLYIFSDNDIGVTDKLPSDPGEGVILFDYTVRAFVIDSVNERIFFSSNKVNPGFYVCDMDGQNVTLIDDAEFDPEGGDDEKVSITGIALDYVNGYVYWAYRGPTNPDTMLNPLLQTGIKRYPLDGNGQVDYLVKDLAAYGIAFDPKRR